MGNAQNIKERLKKQVEVTVGASVRHEEDTSAVFCARGSSEKAPAGNCFLLAGVGDRRVWARGAAAAISERSGLQWKHTSVGWYGSWVPLQLLKVAHTASL